MSRAIHRRCRNEVFKSSRKITLPIFAILIVVLQIGFYGIIYSHYDNNIQSNKDGIVPGMLSDQSRKRIQALDAQNNRDKVVTGKLSDPSRNLIPALIVIGTAKGGTTALSFYLKKHPRMETSLTFEPHFFDYWCEKCRSDGALTPDDIEAIRHEYASKYFNKTKLDENSHLLAFEKTPFYSFDPLVPHLARTIVPWSKILMLLRDPVERAYSDFEMVHYRTIINSKEKFRWVTFETCVQIDTHKLERAGILNDDFWLVDELEREKRWLDYISNLRKGTILSVRGICNGKIGRGLYILQLERWFKEYGNEAGDKIMVMKSESLLAQRNTRKIDLKPITDFIGVEEINITESEQVFAGKNHWPKTPMKDETRLYLRKLCDPFNKKLASLLGKGWENPWPYNDINL